MRRRAFIFITLTFMLSGAFLPPAKADTWLLPEKQKYYSPNKKFYLEVTPKKLESQLSFFKDKVDGRDNAGAVKGVKENYAKGALYVQRADMTYSKRREFQLVNEVAPVSVIVSNDGAYVVTFDNWHSAGYGNDTVVIYRSDGTLVRKFGLEDLLTPGDVETLPHSVSSIWWGGEHFIDEAKGLLVLKVVSNGSRRHDEQATFHELKIELATGRPLEPIRDLFPQQRPRVFSGPYTEATSEAAAATPDPPVCAAAVESPEGAERVPSEQFFARAKERPLPAYPAIAKAANVSGTVVVEVLISKTGDVVCARSLSGHPLLRRTAAHIVLKWKFEPVESSGTPVKAIGAVTIHFNLNEPPPSPAAPAQD
jgi:TonB family protein